MEPGHCKNRFIFDGESVMTSDFFAFVALPVVFAFVAFFAVFFAALVFFFVGILFLFLGRVKKID